jgi:hypothetical protein
MSAQPITMMDCIEAYVHANNPMGSIIDVINPDTGLTWINGQTFEEVRARYADAQRMTLDAWMARKAELQNAPIQWHVTTEERYHEMLNVLPPAMWIAGGFLVGEPDDHHAGTGQPRFRGYRQIGSDYFVSSRPMTRAELRKELA